MTSTRLWWTRRRSLKASATVCRRGLPSTPFWRPGAPPGGKCNSDFRLVFLKTCQRAICRSLVRQARLLENMEHSIFFCQLKNKKVIPSSACNTFYLTRRDVIGIVIKTWWNNTYANNWTILTSINIIIVFRKMCYTEYLVFEFFLHLLFCSLFGVWFLW